MATTEVPVKTFTQRDATKPYSIPLGYLRAFITALVVAHHAVLAYHPYAPAPGASLNASPWWRAFPVVDTAHSGVFTLLVGFNDIFFMSLMFLLSGIFVWNSLQRKGTGKYLRDRLVRLSVPFVAAVVIVAPLAYYPSYLQSKSHPGFVKTWLSLSGWPSGPAWFIWVLLVFGLIAAMLTEWSPKWAERFGSRLASTSKFFAILLAISAATYVPLAVIFDPMSWSSFGPFVFQTSRILHYLAYFLIGVTLGACGIAGALPARRAECWDEPPAACSRPASWSPPSWRCSCPPRCWRPVPLLRPPPATPGPPRGPGTAPSPPPPTTRPHSAPPTSAA